MFFKKKKKIEIPFKNACNKWQQQQQKQRFHIRIKK